MPGIRRSGQSLQARSRKCPTAILRYQVPSAAYQRQKRCRVAPSYCTIPRIGPVAVTADTFVGFAGQRRRLACAALGESDIVQVCHFAKQLLWFNGGFGARKVGKPIDFYGNITVRWGAPITSDGYCFCTPIKLVAYGKYTEWMLPNSGEPAPAKQRTLRKHIADQ